VKKSGDGGVGGIELERSLESELEREVILKGENARLLFWGRVVSERLNGSSIRSGV
jgi:hypothetical protein